MSNVYIKTKIYSGYKSVEYLKTIKNEKIMIVCDKFLSENKSISYLTDILTADNKVYVWDFATPDPSTHLVAQGISYICDIRPTILIGFGGGSAIDTAKAIFYFAKSQNLINQPLFVAVPTTSGTGTEVTSITVITDTEKNVKNVIVTDEILPDIALLDATLTLTVPKSVTANTGMDVFTHALEAYISKDNNVFSDALSEKAIELTIDALSKCYENPTDKHSRQMMQEASTLAGMSFNMAGLGINHSMAHQLGATFHIPHGLANALLLNSIIDYNSQDSTVLKKYAKLICKLPCVSIKEDESPEVALQVLKCIIKSMMVFMEMPLKVSDLNISREDYENSLDIMVQNTLKDRCLDTTPKEISAEDIRKIFLAIY